jgi:hypothetical protein
MKQILPNCPNSPNRKAANNLNIRKISLKIYSYILLKQLGKPFKRLGKVAKWLGNPSKWLGQLGSWESFLPPLGAIFHKKN